MGVSPNAALVGKQQLLAEGRLVRRSKVCCWHSTRLHSISRMPGVLSLKRPGADRSGLLGATSYPSCAEEQVPLKMLRQASLMDSGEDCDFELGGEVGLKASTKSRAIYEVLRVDEGGRNRRVYVKRRDLLRTHGLKPRDLRRIDPFWNKRQSSSHAIVIKDSAFLVSLMGVRCLVTEDRCLLFDPENDAARKFLAFVSPRLRTAAGKSLIKNLHLEQGFASTNGAISAYTKESAQPTPFEMEVLEGVLTVALSQLDSEMNILLKHAAKVLSAVPAEVSPMNLEQLRKTKQSCVELESKAEALRSLLEEILDDEDELVRLNLSSRPAREDRVRQRERERLQREQGSTTQYQNAEDALAEMDDEEEEEKEVEEIEDMLEYYMQRAAGAQAEAQRVLEGARDLEESIGVSLSARRFEVNRLELMLSMGSFAAALGAMISGIFGMNLRSNLEMSMLGFYGVTGLIVVGCFYVFISLFLYTKKRRIV